MNGYPRELRNPYRRIPLLVPEGVSAVEFFNSPCNLRHLARENGLLRTQEGFLLYRKAIGHSNLFDTSIILDTSQSILDPLGRPVRRDQLDRKQKIVFSRMTQVVFEYMLERYPDPERHLVFCGEASLDATWPLSKPGVPSIRMMHNHFLVFDQQDLLAAPAAANDDPNLTDSGNNGLFLQYLANVYLRFLAILDLRILEPLEPDQASLRVTGYPQGLPSWRVRDGVKALENGLFWREYDMVLEGFLDFYRAFFTLVATNEATIPKEAHYPDQIENVLFYSDEFHRAARILRLMVLEDPLIANEIRWRPAYKQLLYRDDADRLIVTISQNSVGNAITELLGIVVKRVEDAEAYAQAEPALVAQLLEVRNRLVWSNLGEPLFTPSWPHGGFVPATG